MHELAITQSIFDIVLKHAREAGARKVTKINLVIGGMTGVVADCVQFYLDFLSRGTVAEGAQVVMTMVPPQVRCRTCQHTFAPEEFNWTCPACRGNSVEVIAGRELFVESIEVD